MSITFEDHEMAQMERAAQIIAAGEGSEVRPFLPVPARAVWDDCEMACEDWDDTEASTLGLLWALCELLRSCESPEWGNTGGRYGHSGGFLNGDDWAAIEAFDDDYEHLDLDSGQWFVIIAAYQVIQRGNLRAVIQMADILDMAADMARA